MDWPYHFPHPADVRVREAERLRRLPAGERLRVIVELAEVGRLLIESSPNRAAIEAQVEADEAAWRQAHRRVFELHGY